MDNSFVNLEEEVILTLLWQSGSSESATVCFVISLSICYWLLKCSVLHVMFVCVLTSVREGDTVTQSRLVWKHIRASALCLSHDSVPLGLELMVKLKTLLTVFTFILKAKARDYGNGRYSSDSCFWCSANHNALGQLANQSRLWLSEGGAL